MVPIMANAEAWVGALKGGGGDLWKHSRAEKSWLLLKQEDPNKKWQYNEVKNQKQLRGERDVYFFPNLT